MSKSLRNSLLLALVLILIIGFGYYWLNMHKKNELKKMQNLKLEKQKEYDELSNLTDKYYVLKDTLESVQKEYYQRDKVLPAYEDSKISFEYINYLGSSKDSYINFTFSTGSNEKFEDYETTTYRIEGDALFDNLYNFIWKIENYKRMYDIQSLQMEEIKKFEKAEEAPKSYINYSMTVKGFSSVEKLSEDKKLFETKMSDGINYNPFLPLIKEYLPPNKEGLLVVDKAKLQGLTADRAFIVDSKGEMRVMKVGDRIYLGYLTRINTEKNQVEFTINKGGFVENVVLKLSNK